jgi:predicted HTH transcriptional regulator
MSQNYDLDYLNKLISDEVEESLQLEYKSTKALGKKKEKDEIAKDVSAMANSAGGTIIYGIKEFDENEKRHLPEKITPISRTEFSKEWLEQVINSNIHPKIDAVIINPISISESEVVYLIEIPQSETVHQASDNRYYKRHNFESVPMDDYEVRDIMNRAKTPKIELEFQMISRTHNSRFSLEVYARNTGKVYAQYINYNIKIPNKYIRPVSTIDTSYHEWEGDNKNLNDSTYEPILPKTRKYLKTFNLKDNLSVDDRSTLIWTVFADNAEPNTGEVLLLLLERDKEVR